LTDAGLRLVDFGENGMLAVRPIALVRNTSVDDLLRVRAHLHAVWQLAGVRAFLERRLGISMRALAPLPRFFRLLVQLEHASASVNVRGTLRYLGGSQRREECEDDERLGGDRH
jgi:hypothetical protein